MSDQSANNKRIAKNTLMLYIRMLLTMGVSLYTSRVILKALGVEDFGIYNVVAGVITMLSFLTGSLGGASSRFITYALGRDDEENIKNVFSSILYLHIALAILVFIIGETIGLWFVCNKLVIPEERLNAALWVYHCSILTMMVSVISVPYNSLIIAHERMSAFAYISIIEVVLKLAVVFLLLYLPFDRLSTYAVLLLIIQVIIRLSYNLYCERHFTESKVRPKKDASLVKEMLSYTSWTLASGVAVVGYTQGLNILLNLFFGPIVNAARGLSVQVQSAIMNFVSNFQTAMRPQIIKSFAVNNLDYMHMLVVMSSKYGLLLMLFLTIPIIVCIHPILRIWLDVVPTHTDSFVIIMLVAGLIEPYKVALLNAIHATGDIKKFQIYESIFLLLVLPVAYIMLKCYHISPEMVMIIYLIIQFITQIVRMLIVLPKISMSIAFYSKKILFPLLRMLPFIIAVVYFISLPEDVKFASVIAYVVCIELFLFACTIVLYLDCQERKVVLSKVKSILKHKL